MGLGSLRQRLIGRRAQAANGENPPASVDRCGEFVSCRFIEGALNFNQDNIAACCIPLPNGKGNVNLADYKGGPLPAAEIERRRDELRSLNNTQGADSPCAGCHHLERKAWGVRDRLVDMITICHYTICNLRCNYCYVADYTPEQRRALSVAPYDLRPVIDAMFRDGMVAPVASACWGGGEPVMFAEFEDVISRFVEHGVHLTLLTNCTIHSTAVARGIAAGVISVWCSVDAGTPETYEVVKGRNLFHKVWETMARYASVNPNLVFAKYIFQDDNFDSKNVSGFVEMCARSGIRRVSLAQNIQRYNGPVSLDRRDLSEALVEAMAGLALDARRRGMEIHFTESTFAESDKMRVRLKLLELALRNGEADIDCNIPDTLDPPGSAAERRRSFFGELDRRLLAHAG